MVNYEIPQKKEMTVQEERTEYGKEKPKAKDTARLIWASKPKKEPNAKELEFQTAEEVYPNIAEKDNKRLLSFVAEKKEISDKPNRLIWGDNLLVMQALLAQGYEGQIDLIYIDPPFNTGENFNFSSHVKIAGTDYEKELPINERLAYTDTWDRNKDSFLDMLYPRLLLMKRLLSSTGTIYIHCDSTASHYIKIITDEIFSPENFQAEIIWKRTTNKGTSFKTFGVEHDIILYYSKTKEHIWNQEYKDYDPSLKNRYYCYFEQEDGSFKQYSRTELNQMEANNQSLPKGRRFALIPLVRLLQGDRPNLRYEFLGRTEMWACNKDKMTELHKKGLIVQKESGALPQKKQYLDEVKGIKVNTIWNDIYPVNSQALQRTGYPTQKPEELLNRIINTSSNQQSIIADFFCGSGTTLRSAEKLNRRWIGSDLSKTAIQVTRSSLVQNNSNPFLIENLGNYQRQLIYAKEVNLKQMYDIILKLYGATPRKDWLGFGISKEDNKTMVFVCEPDRPMTGKKALELAKSAKTADGKGYKRMVILAWDYEYNFDEDFNKLAKNARKEIADVEFKIIPSDVYKFLRSTKVGDQELANKITFYQKPYMRLSEPQIGTRTEDEIRVKIKIEQYVVMDIPIKDESKRPEIEKMLHKNFANLIDYWTVDWDYDGEVFRSKWQAIKDRKSSEPVPINADTTLKKGKKYTIAVRVVDVFGNDASITKEIDLR